MANVWTYIDRMNLFGWVLGIFIAHVLLYVLLGTDTWLATSLLAASVYAVVLTVLKIVAKRYVEEDEKDRIN
ncbi:hypothetical protein LOK74_01210 [Brevibacillus humidisoli]|uniref:hypothetical protein n=1 Tax=Brevibacillus humidisoli TaxID=2895522 RepID=UPI001E53F4CC|nr:hypothetical protein [Brevibacillus humidisoli]UFJ41205.1 hypothetical protein LOK74_01210 [Brevibacillus humidisoli]